MNFKQAISKLFKFSLVLLFIGYYSGISLFCHIHIVNGQAIVHSHFYKTTSDNANQAKEHSHSNTALDLIHAFNKSSFDELVISSPCQEPFSVLLSVLVCSPSAEHNNADLHSIPARAHPAC